MGSAADGRRSFQTVFIELVSETGQFPLHGGHLTHDFGGGLLSLLLGFLQGTAPLLDLCQKGFPLEGGQAIVQGPVSRRSLDVQVFGDGP